MAYEAYISIHGSKQGQFAGNSSKSKRSAKWIEVVSFSFGVKAPRDAATGQASGKRQHKPISITVSPGASSQQLLHALATNEVLKDVTIEFVDTNKDGKEYVYNTIKLTNATISSVRPHAHVTNGKINHGYAVTLETTEVGLSFQKIEIDHKLGKTAASDDWTL